MILMDRGKLKADATVESILPEFSKYRLLLRFDSKYPLVTAPSMKATVRHLAAHTSGAKNPTAWRLCALMRTFQGCARQVHKTGRASCQGGLIIAC